MAETIERNLGPQPIAQLLLVHGLKAHNVVAASDVQITHKMISRACKGRRLTLRTQAKILAAVNKATGKNYTMTDLFTY
ncbi:MAG: hypothetical protein JXA82_08360 [Sedimentisphaerales bacterium]|nr:hypothetical protein [Sedimentisphaerales bacterium]